MSNFKKFSLVFAVISTAIVFIRCQPDWQYDLVSFEVENNTPDKVFIDISVTRPSRGVFALGGYADIREDLPAFVVSSVDVFYSLTGSEFVRTPFHIPEINLETYMNRYYKDLLMESLLNCSDNAPRVDDKFVAPLTKRTIYLHDCIISNENMPSKLKNGYYKIVWQIKNFAETKMVIIVKVFSA